MLIETGRRAKTASKILARFPTDLKNSALLALAEALNSARAEVLAANALDVAEGRANGLSEALIDRLLLNEQRVDGLCADLRHLVELPDPVGAHFDETTLPNGIRLRKQRVPLGVLGVIYESRPNVTLDVAGLAIKTGNAAILRGGKETIHSNRALVQIIRQTLTAQGLPADAIQLIDSPDRALILELLKLHEYVDIIIPRGGAKLHAFCRENSQIPVITGGIGICHLFVDESADPEASLPVIYNAKVQRPSVCNSLDTVLVDKTVAAEMLPRIVEHLAPAGVTFRADPAAASHLTGFDPGLVQPAGPDDFDTEWLSLVLGLKVVSGLDEAMEHIAAHSTAHSDGILTENSEHAARFIAEVDSAAVYVNASTRFTDGSQFGLGAEVAISTQRLHARGPMGLPELTTYKWVAEGQYNVRE
ncbi:MAG TPA: glutamate-5-semialdehyde dehydrogenase [Anaerolineae bacterium]|jgi:glutamate-5-semialdehyde dehydrogenase|nr:glutamate-5-semialdehyde dehydrogenase [Anaerolineae bacterium]